MRRSKYHNRKLNPPKEEQGIVMIMALMIGLMLIAGATGLVIRQLMARKIGTFDSYQQMAENAAVNGFNRILGTLNNPSDENGHFYLLNNASIPDPSTNTLIDNYQWEDTNPVLDEYCTNKPILPIHPEGGNLYWPTGRTKGSLINQTAIPITLNTVSSKGEATTLLRTDGNRGVQPSFRLRSYKLLSYDTTKGKGKGVFEVEGIVKRTSTNGKKDQAARFLMTRYLDIFASVDAPKHWAVLAGENFNLGNGRTKIYGDGLVAWLTSTPPQNCNNMPGNIERKETSTTDLDPLIWPINSDRGLPTAVLFKGDETEDTSTENSSERRIWSFDDRESDVAANRGSCTAIACTRENNGNTYSAPSLLDNGESSNIIKIKHDEICTSKPNSNVCHLYIEHMYLDNTKIFIEATGKNDGIRKIVLHLALPARNPDAIGEGGSIVLGENSQLCVSTKVVIDATPQCNEKPEELVIASSEMSSNWYSATTCSDTTNTVSIKGDSLPAAWLAIAHGSVQLTGNTTLKGIIWSRSICSNGHSLDLYASSDTNLIISKDSNAQDLKSASYVYDAAKAWQWEEYGFRGFGKTTLRGLRGDGLDNFQRFGD